MMPLALRSAAALENTSCPKPNSAPICGSSNVDFVRCLPDTAFSAGGGMRGNPAASRKYLAAHTSMVASLPNPIRLPVKFTVFGALPGLICLNIFNKASVAAGLLVLNNASDAFVISLKGLSSSLCNLFNSALPIGSPESILF